METHLDVKIMYLGSHIHWIYFLIGQKIAIFETLKQITMPYCSLKLGSNGINLKFVPN